MPRIESRLRELEHAAGLAGGGCPEREGRAEYRPWHPNAQRADPAVTAAMRRKPEPILCPRCGRDMLTIIKVVEVPVGREPWAGRGEERSKTIGEVGAVHSSAGPRS